MKLTLKRDLKTEFYTAGELSVDGTFLCWTLEDAVRTLGPKCEGKVPARTAIPAGTYEVAITFSNRFKKLLPLLMNVPCFEGIRIHSGNTADDSEGCILVGLEKSASGAVFKSRAAFDLLMSKIKSVNKKEKVFIEIV